MSGNSRCISRPEHEKVKKASEKNLKATYSLEANYPLNNDPSNRIDHGW